MCLIRYREARIGFYAHAGQMLQALTHMVWRNRNWGRIRGSSCLATSAAQQIRHLPSTQTAHNLGDSDHESYSGCICTDSADNITRRQPLDRKSTRLNSSHLGISHAVF